MADMALAPKFKFRKIFCYNVLFLLPQDVLLDLGCYTLSLMGTFFISVPSDSYHCLRNTSIS